MAIEAEALLARLEAAVTEIHGHITTPEGMAAWNRLNDADVAIRSALAEDTARAAEGWEPIETAPKDGSLIHVARPMPRGGYRVEVSAWRSDTFGEYHWARDGRYDRSWNAPTHWRRLPAPPALPLDKQAADANR